MYAAFPRSEYYDSSDFSKSIPAASFIRLGYWYPYLGLDASKGGAFEISPVNSSDLFTHARHLDPAGSESTSRFNG